MKPRVVMVNPDMPDFNDRDVCQNLMEAMDIAVILLIDAHSTVRDTAHHCRAEEVVTKPTDFGNLANLIAKHITVNQ